MEHPSKSLSHSEEYIYDPGENFEIDEDPTSNDVGLNCINQTPSTHLSVVRCVPSQLAEKDDWRKSATFCMFTKIGKKKCKVIVDSRSCINAISSKSLKNFRLKDVLHPRPFKVHGLAPRHLRSNNDVLSQSISIIIKTRLM